jgi:hypothetical protein
LARAENFPLPFCELLHTPLKPNYH